MLDRSMLATEGTHLARFLRGGAVGTGGQDGLRSMQLIAAAVPLRGDGHFCIALAGPWIGDLACRRDRGFLRST